MITGKTRSPSWQRSLSNLKKLICPAAGLDPASLAPWLGPGIQQQSSSWHCWQLQQRWTQNWRSWLSQTMLSIGPGSNIWKTAALRLFAKQEKDWPSTLWTQATKILLILLCHYRRLCDKLKMNLQIFCLRINFQFTSAVIIAIGWKKKIIT